MNVFRFLGDMLHLGSVLLILLKILSQKSCRGISLKTQILYAVVFSARYLDILWNFYSIYNSIMKIIFICSSIEIVYLMKYKSPYCKTYDEKNDSFNIWFLVAPSAFLAIICNLSVNIFETFWAFSIFLESVALVPQLIVVYKSAKEQSGRIENLTTHYVVCLGGYRAFYLLNWIYRSITERGYRDYISWFAGIVQTVLYADFFYYYARSKWLGQHMELP
ncbi:hypothetical protein MHBO_003759, partial [Bonamia ostreae]